MDSYWTLLTDPNTQWVLFGCLLLGVASGVLGCFALLRRHSLLGDAVAHAALPGICIAFLLTGSKSMLWFMIGAAVVGWLASLCIGWVTRYSRIHEDTALGVVLTVFFGIGIVLLTYIQHSAGGSQSGLDSFLFGKAASMVLDDVLVMAGAAVVLLTICALFFKEFKLLAFDPGFARGIGMPAGLLDALLMLLLVAAVVIGLQAVGVVLMAAMLITPALAARYWTERLDRMIVLAGLFGALSGALGTFVSALVVNMPTGPVIVLSATLLFLFSLFCAPRRGLLAKIIRLAALRNRVARENVLQSLYELMERDARQGGWPEGGYGEEQLLARRPIGERVLRATLQKLGRNGLVQSREQGWLLSEAGLEDAQGLTLNLRLWDLFTMYEARFGAIVVDRDRGDLIAQLPADTRAELHELLRQHDMEPTLSKGGGSR